LANTRRTIATESRVEEHDFAAASDRRRRKGVGEFVGTGAGRNQSLLDVIKRRVLDITFNAALSATIVQAEHLDVPNLVFEAVGSTLGLGGPNEGHGSFEAERQTGAHAGENQVTPRDFKHVFLLGWPTRGPRFDAHSPLAPYTPDRVTH